MTIENNGQISNLWRMFFFRIGWTLSKDYNWPTLLAKVGKKSDIKNRVLSSLKTGHLCPIVYKHRV